MIRLFFVAIGLLASCKHSAPPPTTITVGAAISLKEAAEELKPPGDVQWAFGASGDLASQMERGAPFDVLVAAGEQRILAGLATEKCTIAWNTLVLVKHRGAASVGWSELTSAPASFRLAIGYALSVPAGAYAEEALRKLGVWDGVAPKIVRGTNVRNVLDLVARGEADEGIVYATDVRISKDVEVVAEVPASARPNVRYPVYVANAARKEEMAVADYLCAPDARRVLVSHGFLDHPP
jgi:molybdate transport system substrate-binding protein